MGNWYDPWIVITILIFLALWAWSTLQRQSILETVKEIKEIGKELVAKQ